MILYRTLRLRSGQALRRSNCGTSSPTADAVGSIIPPCGLENKLWIARIVFVYSKSKYSVLFRT
jgi:hypothetical protein